MKKSRHGRKIICVCAAIAVLGAIVCIELFAETSGNLVACYYMCKTKPSDPDPGPHHTVAWTKITDEEDWTPERRAYEDQRALIIYNPDPNKPNIQIIGSPSSTKKYNCHAYAFGHTHLWIANPAAYKCNDDHENHRGGYEKDETGPIFRWTERAHSAFQGSHPFPYKAKLGDGPLVYHSDNGMLLYDVHDERWKERTDQ